VQDVIQAWKPGERKLIVTSGRDVQAVRAWAAKAMPADRSADPDVLIRRWVTQPGQMMRLDPRTGKVENVDHAAGDGIYFARHGETDGNDNPAVPEEVRAERGSLREAADQPKRKTGPHGPIAREFEGKPKEALRWVRDQKTGFAAGAIPHPAGAIGLAFAEKPDPAAGRVGYGVAHIDQQHPGWLDRHVEEIANWPVVEEIPDRTGRITGRVLADGKGNRAVVSLDWKGQPHPEWLLTGYERGGAGLRDQSQRSRSPEGCWTDSPSNRLRFQCCAETGAASTLETARLRPRSQCRRSRRKHHVCGPLRNRLRIPGHADQRSELMSITIPK
jgi:hypothetical protein